jgi:fluoride ion exporter CrcB/FEX
VLKSLNGMKLTKTASYALIAFFAAWQATEFSLEYRAIMGALVAGLMGGLSTTNKPTPKP